MTLSDYIEKLRSVDMVGKTPVKVYEELLSIAAQYYDDTEDTCLSNCYCSISREVIQDTVERTLKNSGWASVWRYLQDIPENALDDNYFRSVWGCLRPINWDDVAELQRFMIKTLQDKQPQLSKKEELTQALRSLVDAVHKVESLINEEEVK